jgi:hypothetical protein
MSKHTPAPWVLKIRPAEHDDNVTVAEIEQPRSVKYRGAVTRMQSAEHIYGIGKDELIANARLIAAAPDMLEALKLCANYIANTESEFGITLPCGENARAAITKAEALS